MADTKITALTALTAADPANDVLPIVDVSDTTMAASGTTKKISVNNILGASGTATLASATITGDLTVDTSTLKVDSANNRVGVVNASPSFALDVNGAGSGVSARISSGSGTGFRFDTTRNVGGLNRNYLIGCDVLNEGWFSIVPSTALGGGTFTNSIYNASYDGTHTWNDGAGSERMRLNSTGLGVGVTPAAGDGSGVFKAAGTGVGITNTRLGLDVREITSGNAAGIWLGAMNNENTGVIGSRTASGNIAFQTFNGASWGERMRIDYLGNVGIGVTPKPWRSGARALQLGANGYLTLNEQANGNANICFAAYEGSANVFNYTTTGDLPSRYVLVSGTHQWYTAPSGTAGNAITFTEVMRLDASGNLFVGKTATGLGTVGIQASPSGWIQATVSGDASLFTNRLASDGKTIQLYRQTLEVGNISVTTTGATFNSTSDYRLKEAVAPLSGGLARVNALKPSVYKWKSNGLSGEGFLAHELAEVVPAAVNGEKDDVNEDGSIKAQSIDMSRVVPILVAAIQELTAEVNALKNA